MFKNKLLASVLLVLAVLFAQVGNVAAAPQAQDTTPPEITNIEMETDANNVTTVLVTLLYSDQTEEVVRISYDYAVSVGLIDSTTQQPVAIEQLPDGITLDPNEVMPDEEPVEEDIHPIAALLADFFNEDASVINQYHEDGFGFGVIAQALWMSRSITENEDASVAGCILDAKQNGTYGECFDFGDEPVPTNWGQFKKALKENREKHNLGVIVSGQADEETQETLSPQDHGNNQERDKGPANDHGNGKDKKKKKP